MKDALSIVEIHGQRLLSADEWPYGGVRVRILTEDALHNLGDSDYHLYRKRFRLLVQQAGSNATLQNPDTIKAYDYLRNAVRREDKNRPPHD